LVEAKAQIQMGGGNAELAGAVDQGGEIPVEVVAAPAIEETQPGVRSGGVGIEGRGGAIGWGGDRPINRVFGGDGEAVGQSEKKVGGKVGFDQDWVLGEVLGKF
jgi:hypothetical protein